MVEDTTEKEADTEDGRRIGRRSYLRLAGAAVGSALVANTLTQETNAATGDGYDTIEVSAGETRRIDIRSGETFENAIVDITADGANVQIRANGENWTMRNIAIRGSPPPKAEGGNAMMVCYDTGGNSLIEHCWFGDGSGGGTWDEAMAGVFVHARHAGTLTVRDCYFRGWLNNALYASPPGNEENQYFTGGNIGQGGEVHAENCYFEDNNVSSIRLGSAGSSAKDCVVNGGDHRGCWAYYEHIDFVNVHSTAARAFESGGRTHDHQGSAVIDADNCQADGDLTEKGGAEILGAPGSDPDTTPPAGVPLSAEESATGTSSSSSDSDQEGALLELISEPDTSETSYSFTVEGGDVSMQTSGTHAAEGNDYLIEADEDTTVVSGVAGNGYGDSYLVTGSITSMQLDESKWTLRYDDKEVSKMDIVVPNTIVIDGSAAPGETGEYTFSVSGAIEKATELSTSNEHDTVSDGQATGRVAGGVDVYRFSGEFTSLDVDGDVRAFLDD